jgi:hypothetical protein
MFVACPAPTHIVQVVVAGPKDKSAPTHTYVFTKYLSQSGISDRFRIFEKETRQQVFFEKTALPMVQELLDGYNSLLFTYGVTNSGKTYTILVKIKLVISYQKLKCTDLIITFMYPLTTRGLPRTKAYYHAL